MSWTPMFAPVSGIKVIEEKEVYQLKDFTALNMDPYSDSIQFLDPDSATTYLQVVYLDEETYGEEMAGWWDINGDFSSDEYRMGDQSFPYGTSFLAAFTSGAEIQINYSGSVIKDEKSFSFTQESVFFGNYIPKDLTLADISATGMDPYSDSIQFLDPDSATTYLQVVYLDEETYGEEMAGWWDINGDFASEEYKKGTEPVPAGQGFLAAFTSGAEITVTFPAAY